MEHGLYRLRRASSQLHKASSTSRHHATSRTGSTQTQISNLEPDRQLPYPKLQSALQTLRRRLDRPLTLSEKVLYTHLRNPLEQELERGKSFLLLDPDRAACHDATATMAMLQFISAGLPATALPTSIHSDHLIVAENGALADLANAKRDYSEAVSIPRKHQIERQTDKSFQVYHFLGSASKKYGIGFWKPGSGIIHTIILENYAL